MNKTLLKSLFILILIILNIDANEVKKLNFSKSELEFIKQNKQIVLGTDKQWEPYIIQNSNGVVSGYDTEVIDLINNLTGLNIKLTTGSWKDMQQKAQDKIIDGLSTGTASPKRASYLNYTNPYISMHKMIITSNKSNQYINSLDDLEDKVIAIHDSNAVDEKLAKRFKNSIILKVASVKELLQSVASNKADAMFGNGATLYLANQMGLMNLNLSVSLNEQMDLVFSFRKEYPEAITIVNKALDFIGKQKLLEIKKKWFLLKNDTIKSSIFTKEEQLYLKNKQNIKMCVDPIWLPFDAIDNGKHIGIAADYINLIKKDIQIPIELISTENWSQTLQYSKDRKCDIISLAMETPNRKKYLNFTRPYLKVPLVIATKPDKSFIVDFDTLENKKVGIVKDYAFFEILTKKYPNINLITVNSTDDGLQKVKDGKLFGYIGSLASIGYKFQTKFTGELKIAGKFDSKWEMGIAVRDDDKVLLNILDKYLGQITQEQKANIQNKWIAIKYEKGMDTKLIYKIIIIVVIIVIFFIMTNRKLKNKVKIATLNLQDKNNKLEESIKNFQDILDATMEMVVFYSLDTKEILNINQSGVEMLGFEEKSEVIGKPIFEFLPKSELPKVQESIKKDISNQYELTLIKKDGTFIYTLNRARTIVLNGEKTRMTTLIDLTEIKRQNKFIQQQSKLAQMGEMISMIAHQWRQPLGAISSAVFSMQTKVASNRYDLSIVEQRSEFVEFINNKHKNINEYVQVLSSTVDDFRNFFKPDKDKEFVCLNEPIEKALQIVKTSMENKGINLIIDFTTNDKIYLYKNEMMQVVLNILKNSEDNFLDKKTINPNILITTKKDKDNYVISIGDNGGGISEDILPSIYEPYFSTKDEKNGTGLGLYMSKIIVEEHNGGTLEIKNLDDGVCFIIILKKS